MSQTDKSDEVRAVGVVGLGEMGLPIAGHLQDKGTRPVLGYDVAPAVVERAFGHGIQCVPDVESLVDRCDLLLILVGTDAQVSDFLAGDGGVFHHSSGRPTQLRVAVSSTVSLKTIKGLASSAPANVMLVDVPLARAAHAATTGTLLAFFGGAATELEEWSHSLHTFCTDIVHVGELGTGQISKTLNNYLLWANVCANNEALTLGGLSGCDPTQLRRALLLGSGANWALETWEKTRPMPWAEDDMAILDGLSRDIGLELPLAGEVARQIARVKEQKKAAGLEGNSMAEFVSSALHGS